jgi:hypothetical protein
MSNAETPPPSLEDIGAGLLNGTMVTLLGSILPAVLVWQIVAQLSGWLPNLMGWTVDLPSTDFGALSPEDKRAVIDDSARAIPLLLASFWALRGGIKHIRQNLRQLRARLG